MPEGHHAEIHHGATRRYDTNHEDRARHAKAHFSFCGIRLEDSAASSSADTGAKSVDFTSESSRVDRLGEAAVAAVGTGFILDQVGGVGAQDQDRHIAPTRAQGGGGFKPPHSRHFEIDQDDILFEVTDTRVPTLDEGETIFDESDAGTE